MRRPRKNSVLVLNSSYEPLHYVSPKDAVRMLFRNVAVMEEFDPDQTGFAPYEYPVKLRLIRYVKMDWFYAKPVVWSKSGVLRRDRFVCAYCGGHADTIDHVMPQSRGGASDWTNCVSACFKCNNKKSNRTPEEAGLTLRFHGYKPRREQLVGFNQQSLED